MSERKHTDISLILKDMLKVIKVVSMYPEDNPLPQSLRRSFAEKLESIIEDYGEIRIVVQKDCLFFEGEKVFEDRSKEENLSAIFFDAGITEFVFKIGLQVDEIYTLLDVLKQYMNSSDKTIDIIALFWESGITQIAFKSLEDMALTDYDDKFDLNEFISRGGTDGFETNGMTSREAAEAEYQAIFYQGDNQPSENAHQVEQSHLDETSDMNIKNVSGGTPVPKGSTVLYQPQASSLSEDQFTLSSGDEESLKAFEAVEAMGFGDLSASGSEPTISGNKIPDTNLILNDEFKLSEEEEKIIRQLIEKDTEFDPYESTKEIIKEIILQETEKNGFSESVTICEKIIGEFISTGHLAETASLMKFLKKLDEKINPDKPAWSDRVKDALVSVGSRERLFNLVDSLNNNSNISSVELNKFLNNFGWEALSGISDTVGHLVHKTHRDCVSKYLTEKGKDNVDLVARGIYDKKTENVINAISILTQIADNKAMKYLARTAIHKDPEVRLELMKVLKNCSNDECLEILKKGIEDSYSEIRKEAVNSLLEKRGQKAFEIITDIINEDSFLIIDKGDQATLLKAYSILGGEQAVSYLSNLILRYNFFRNSALAFFRQAAFEALSYNNSEKSEKTLLMLANSWRPDIKAQAQNTLQRRRENIYGGR